MTDTKPDHEKARELAKVLVDDGGEVGMFATSYLAIDAELQEVRKVLVEWEHTKQKRLRFILENRAAIDDPKCPSEILHASYEYGESVNKTQRALEALARKMASEAER
jgi:hypothetical protein